MAARSPLSRYALFVSVAAAVLLLGPRAAAGTDPATTANWQDGYQTLYQDHPSDDPAGDRCYFQAIPARTHI